MTTNKFPPPNQNWDNNKQRRIVQVSFADSRYANALKRLEAYTKEFTFTERHFHTEKNSFTKQYWKELKPWLYEGSGDRFLNHNRLHRFLSHGPTRNRRSFLSPGKRFCPPGNGGTEGGVKTIEEPKGVIRLLKRGQRQSLFGYAHSRALLAYP